MTAHYHTGNLKRSVPGMSVFLLDIPDNLLPASQLSRQMLAIDGQRSNVQTL
jgi:hypothetical protein